MFDSLSNVLQQQPQGSAEQGYQLEQMNTAGIAGKLIAFGMQPKDAYVQAAQLARQQEMGNIERQKQQVEQMQKQQFSQLADYVRSNPNVSNQELAGTAMELGVDPRFIPAFLGALGAEDKVVQDAVYGPTIFRKHAGNIQRDGQQQINTLQPPPQNIAMNDGNDTQLTTQQLPINRVEAREKYKSNLRKEEHQEKENEAYYKELADSSKLASGLIDKYTQMEELIPKVYSAPGASVKANVMKVTGLNKQKVADYEQFRALAGDVVFDLLATQKGVQTNEDREKMAETKPGPENTPEGNMAIAKSRKALLKRNLEYNKAAEEWVRQGRSKTEFESKWEAYVSKNPLLSRDKNGVLKVNTENLSNWREHIFGKKTTQETPGEIFRRRFGEEL